MPLEAPYDARAVGNFVIRAAREQGVQLTQMSILKILFYAHGWYLADFDKPLLKQPVEAWKYGPVVKVVKDAFEKFGSNPVTEFARRLDLETGEYIEVLPDLSLEDAAFVRNVVKRYSRFSAFKLSDMTHEPDTPWDKIWNTTGTIGRLGLRIKNEEIKSYFKSIKSLDTMH